MLERARFETELSGIEGCVSEGTVDKDHVLRGALWVSVVYNAGAALLFAFPSSPLSQLAGLPARVPPIYAALLAFFVALFGGAYAWLARQPSIDRPLVALAAIGKAGVFALMVTFWLLGEVPGRGVLAAVGDLVLAGIFAWWLLGGQPGAPEVARQDAPRDSLQVGRAGEGELRR
jgi:hypothetical protein